MITSAHECFWTRARRKVGDAASTRALIEVLLLHRRLPFIAVHAALDAAHGHRGIAGDQRLDVRPYLEQGARGLDQGHVGTRDRDLRHSSRDGWAATQLIHEREELRPWVVPDHDGAILDMLPPLPGDVLVQGVHYAEIPIRPPSSRHRA